MLISGNIVWLYDDTECFNTEGDQLSFISNTAAFASQPNKDTSTVQDFGVDLTGQNKYGTDMYAILAGWIPFQKDELNFNEAKKGVERVAICTGSIGAPLILTDELSAGPGTSPTPINIKQAFFFAPLVYVDSKPQDPSKEYQARGMTLITITAPNSGPVAVRRGDLTIPGTQVDFGGFATLLGAPSAETGGSAKSDKRDVYLLGMTTGGLQLARVHLDNIDDYSKYTYFDPVNLNFSRTPPKSSVSDGKQIYLPGTFSSGSVFFSPYFRTFLIIYFNKMVDSTFYIRYLDLQNPLSRDSTWVTRGRKGKGIQHEDTEALVKYKWSEEQILYVSPTSKGGFNYAGNAHPEYFNRQYFAPSLYNPSTPSMQRRNGWYGSNLVAEADAGGDGRHLMLSWTSQLRGGKDIGIYQIQLAMVEFDDIPTTPTTTPSTAPNPSAAPTTTSNPTDSAQEPASSPENMMPKNAASTLRAFTPVVFLQGLGVLAIIENFPIVLGFVEDLASFFIPMTF